jgi:hypothetical protein
VSEQQSATESQLWPNVPQAPLWHDAARQPYPEQHWFDEEHDPEVWHAVEHDPAGQPRYAQH